MVFHLSPVPRALAVRTAAAAPCLIVAALMLLPATARAELPLKPYRALVLADARARDGQVFRDAGELGDALALFALWGIPHDILRLDTHMLRAEDLVDQTGQPVYGVILWAARTDLLPREFQEGQVLLGACREHHISLIAFGSRIDVPAVREILGLRAAAGPPRSPPPTGDPPHFITRYEQPLPPLADEPWCAGGPTIETTARDVEILIHQNDRPLLTARTLDAASNTRAVWLGGDANRLLRGGGSGLGVRLFQRALVWSLGAALVHDFDDTLLLRMDDPGAAQSSYLHGWNYPSLSASLIRRKILVPLEKYHARLDVFCCPGYVDSRTRSILHSEKVNRIDAFGNRQDIRSMFAAFGEGQKKGLIEIGSHGWTHLDPDLATPPPDGTDWWDGTTTTTWAEDGWYGEFYDLRRNKEVPADIQLQHLRTSCDWLEACFGRRPLAFCPPGHAISGDSCVYGSQMAGTVEIQLDGAEPNASYSLLVGEEEDWIPVGELQADSAGAIRTTLPAPADLWLDARGHFTINRTGQGTQAIAGPIHEALGFDFTLSVRDKARMIPDEREEFPEAHATFRQGRITGHLNRNTYQPPTRSAACTYQAAGCLGFGLLTDTACHCLDGRQVTTLRMVPVECFPEDIEPAMSSHRGVPTIFRFHDRDLVLSSDYLTCLLKSLAGQDPTPTYLTADELSGYLHARWTLRPGPGNTLTGAADFSHPACRYLCDHQSSWRLLATDELLAALCASSGDLTVREEGQADQTPPRIPGHAGTIPLRISAGKGKHILICTSQPARPPGTPPTAVPLGSSLPRFSRSR